MTHGDGERHGNHDGDRGDDGSSLNIEDRRDNLPPWQQRLRMMHDYQNRADASAAPRESHALPNVGSFVPLANPSWAAQADLIRNNHDALGFDPTRLFDGIVAAKSGLRGLYDPGRRDYAKYEGLRTNLAVMRNTLLGRGVKPPQIKTIAEALGEAFANDNWLKRPFTHWLNVDVANVEGVGASEMYKYLLEVQHTPAPLQTLRVAINSLLGIPDRNWGLPPLEETPFSPANLAMSAPVNQAADVSGPAPQQNFTDRYLASRDAAAHFSKA